MKQLDNVELFVCSEDATQPIGFADKAEVWTEGGSSHLILRGVNGVDKDAVLQAENECLRRDVEFYKKLWQARSGWTAPQPEVDDSGPIEVRQNRMTEYTAADFANAMFAEHPDGRVAARVKPDEDFAWAALNARKRDGWLTDYGMANQGWVPVIPARTIHDRDVEALCTDTASYERDDYLDGFLQGFQQAGGVILDDPEPTNKEKWVTFLRKVNPDSIMIGDYAEAIVAAGVTAPEDDA